ncbi:hypothetical protein ACFX2I_031854 [Malus domestica]
MGQTHATDLRSGMTATTTSHRRFHCSSPEHAGPGADSIVAVHPKQPIALQQPKQEGNSASLQRIACSSPDGREQGQPQPIVENYL